MRCAPARRLNRGVYSCTSSQEESTAETQRGVASLFTSPTRVTPTLFNSFANMMFGYLSNQAGMDISLSVSINERTVVPSNAVRPARRLHRGVYSCTSSERGDPFVRPTPSCGSPLWLPPRNTKFPFVRVQPASLNRLFSTLWDTVMLSETHPRPALSYTPGV